MSFSRRNDLKIIHVTLIRIANSRERKLTYLLVQYDREIVINHYFSYFLHRDGIRNEKRDVCRTN